MAQFGLERRQFAVKLLSLLIDRSRLLVEPPLLIVEGCPFISEPRLFLLVFGRLRFKTFEIFQQVCPIGVALFAVLPNGCGCGVDPLPFVLQLEDPLFQSPLVHPQTGTVLLETFLPLLQCQGCLCNRLLLTPNRGSFLIALRSFAASQLDLCNDLFAIPCQVSRECLGSFALFTQGPSVEGDLCGVSLDGSGLGGESLLFVLQHDPLGVDGSSELLLIANFLLLDDQQRSVGIELPPQSADFAAIGFQP